MITITKEFTFFSADGTEILRIDPHGKIYVHGKYTKNNQRVAREFEKFVDGALADLCKGNQ